MNPQLSHFDEQGRTRMVDVGSKPETQRFAVASAVVEMQPETLQLIINRQFAKGDVFEVARLAGIMASKRTAELIPLCHPLPISNVEIAIDAVPPNQVRLVSTVKVNAQTGAEMEALSAVSVAALTLYDMCKSVDRAMVIRQVQLEEKDGGKSGHFLREEIR